ncbi:helix-turn-helix domain-containing protein [Flavobacterium johnsoniae]|uniref:helix-turn-helix domain-containing protein n=1 Tax=Flavobacterium TaxID=237 RepID=UPI000DAE736A|nr:MULTISPECIES: helix-turn-helix transcriptional regulator [Flavobacterium]KAF2082073.1 helix-turn-helix transcriptional regulator [Flavobacterium sharifuzzamanii]WJS96788.1 helix-turn-helix domain-containing protein [Flavobacterium johnsoniae]
MEKEQNSKFLISFGNNLHKFRTAKKLSYRKLAQMCNVDHSQISKTEKGQKSIQLKTIFDLARALDVHPKDFFDFDFELKKDE